MTLLIPGNDVEISNEPIATEDAVDFIVENINPPRPYFWKPGQAEEWAAKNPQRTPEAFSHRGEKLLKSQSQNGLVSAAHTAFDQHFPLVLTPDTVWITLTMGLATHIDKNAETLRKQFVSHEGKRKIIVRRDL